MSGAGGFIGQGKLADLAAAAWNTAETEPWFQVYCTLTRASAGIYDLALLQPASQENCTAQVTFRGSGAATGLVPTVVHTSASSKQIRIVNAGGVATDHDFDIYMKRIAPPSAT